MSTRIVVSARNWTVGLHEDRLRAEESYSRRVVYGRVRAALPPRIEFEGSELPEAVYRAAAIAVARQSSIRHEGRKR